MVMMLKREFTDAQKEARDSFNINTIVSAGAGSGKTSVLVARYLQLLSRGMAERFFEVLMKFWPLPLPEKQLRKCVPVFVKVFTIR
jgi:ATP-dependent exoDNAse (exonuclease V) beta subunit